MKDFLFPYTNNKRVSLACLPILGVVISGITGCQSAPPTEAADINNEVCVGDPVIDDPGSAIDLEEMAREVECP